MRRSSRSKVIEDLRAFTHLVDTCQEFTRLAQREVLYTTLQQSPRLASLLQLALDPFEQFHFNSSTVPDRPEACSDDFLKILADAAGGRVGPDLSASRWHYLLSKTAPHIADAATQILDKDIGWDLTRGDVNRVLRALDMRPINRFTFPSKTKRIGRKTVVPDFCAMYELLEGTACVAVLRRGRDALLLDRNQTELDYGCGVLSDIDVLTVNDCVLLGTLVLQRYGDKTEHGFLVTDCLTLREFDLGRSNASYNRRLERIDKILAFVSEDKVQKQLMQTHAPAAYQFAEKRGWKGIVFRTDSPYDARSYECVQTHVLLKD